jgi:hypothetical protein
MSHNTPNYLIRKTIHSLMCVLNRILGYKIWAKGKEPKIEN